MRSGLKRKVLYLADRNILVDQSIEQDFAPLEKTIHKINFVKDDPVTITSYEVYFSLYQQLTGDNGSNDEEAEEDDTASRLAALFQKDFFDLVILICARNGSKRLVGKAAIIDREGLSFGAFMAIFRSLCNDCVLQVINSAYFRNSLLGDTGTTTINQITQDMLKNALAPLPPLAEQKRIVARLEELLPLCERLRSG